MSILPRVQRYSGGCFRSCASSGGPILSGAECWLSGVSGVPAFWVWALGLIGGVGILASLVPVFSGSFGGFWAWRVQCCRLRVSAPAPHLAGSWAQRLVPSSPGILISRISGILVWCAVRIGADRGSGDFGTRDMRHGGLDVQGGPRCSCS